MCAAPLRRRPAGPFICRPVRVCNRLHPPGCIRPDISYIPCPTSDLPQSHATSRWHLSPIPKRQRKGAVSRGFRLLVLPHPPLLLPLATGGGQHRSCGWFVEPLGCFHSRGGSSHMSLIWASQRDGILPDFRRGCTTVDKRSDSVLDRAMLADTFAVKIFGFPQQGNRCLACDQG